MFFLTKEKKCQIHDIKPSSCVLQPFTIVDYDYHNNTIVVDLATIDCPGVNTAGILPVDRMAKAAKIAVNDLLVIVAKTMKLPINDERALSRTRKLLMGLWNPSFKWFFAIYPK